MKKTVTLMLACLLTTGISTMVFANNAMARNIHTPRAQVHRHAKHPQTAAKRHKKHKKGVCFSCVH